MFKESDQIEKFEPKVWLSSPTMHGEEFEFLKEAYETNWMSTVGRNIDEVEHQMAEIIGCKYAVGWFIGGNRSITLGNEAGWGKKRHEGLLL